MGDRNEHNRHRDDGFTLIEMLLVILILGVLASVVVFAVSDMRTDAAESGCATDERVLAVAFESYVADSGNTTVSPTGAGADAYEQTLVDAGLLTSVSEYYDMDADGVLTPEADSGC